jgi:hypothetical protein
MANKFSRGHNFTDGPPNDDVIAAYLHALIEEAAPTTAFVDDQVEKSLVTGDYTLVKDTPGNRLARVKTDALLGQVSSGITVGDIQVPDNVIQNADMWYWQRGLNVDRILNGTNLAIYGPDRFKLVFGGTWNLKVRNLDDQDLVFSGYPRNNRVARITAVDAHSSLGGTDYVLFQYGMEGFDFAQIDGLPWTYTMWMRTNRTGMMYASVRAWVSEYVGGTYEHYLQDFLINPNGVTQLQLSFPARISNLAYKNNSSALNIALALAVGTTYQGSASTAWAAGSGSVGTTRQTNFFDAANNYVDIWGPCLRTGSIAVPQRVSASDLAKVQRYYAKSYATNINPAAGSFDGAQLFLITAASYARGKVNFPVAMRANPTLAIYNPSTGAINSVYNMFTAANYAVTGTPHVTDTGFSGVDITGGVTRDSVMFHYTAEADF